jgi:uncharacterized membrane protein
MEPSQNDLEAIRRILAELTNRITLIEHKLGMDSPAPVSTAAPSPQPTAAVPPPSAVAPVQPPYPLAPPPLPPPPHRTVAAHTAQPDLESRIGSHWLNRIGILALLIGISYFLKFAFENNWIGPGGRVTIGLIAGIAMVMWSERFRIHGYKAFSYSLKAVGIGALYLSLWAAFHVYSLIPSGGAFAMMLVVTAATAAMAPSFLTSRFLTWPRSFS